MVTVLKFFRHSERGPWTFILHQALQNYIVCSSWTGFPEYGAFSAKIKTISANWEGWSPQRAADGFTLSPLAASGGHLAGDLLSPQVRRMHTPSSGFSFPGGCSLQSWRVAGDGCGSHLALGVAGDGSWISFGPRSESAGEEMAWLLVKCWGIPKETISAQVSWQAYFFQS